MADDGNHHPPGQDGGPNGHPPHRARAETLGSRNNRPRGTTGGSNIVDFGVPMRAMTSPASDAWDAAGGGGAARSSGRLERHGSMLSRLSSAGDSIRRRPTRTNTVTTYHQAETPVPGPGAEPGIDINQETEDDLPHLQALKAECDINIIDFGEDDLAVAKCSNDDLGKFLDEERPEDMPCRWISVNGLSWDVIKTLGRRFDLHRLAIEDLIQTHSRTKVDWYKDHAFIVLTLQKLVRLHQNDGHHDCPAYEYYDERNKPAPSQAGYRWWRARTSSEKNVLPRYLDRDGDGKVDETIRAHSGVTEESPIKEIRTLHRYESSQIPEHTAFMEKHSALAGEDLVVSVEQVSIFLTNDNTVISFFEHSAEDIERPLLERLQSSETILRRTTDASLLTQAIIDAIVDLILPVKEAYNKARKELQVDAMTNPNIKTSRALHIFGEEIDMLQNLFKPIVHLVNALRDHNSEPMQTPPLVPDTSAAAMSTDRPPLAKTMRDDKGEAVSYGRKVSDFRRVPLRRAQTASTVTLSPLAHVYFGDVLDHCITIIQALEQMDASANNISTLIFNTVGAKTNNTMMILAVVTVIFAPLTFISGYFGMNFSSGAGLAHPFAFFWTVAMPSLVGFMVIIFATMLWDNIRDWLAKRGIRSHRRRRPRIH